MCRFEGESASLNTYFPGFKTAPGICIGLLIVMTVFLFQGSAQLFEDIRTTNNAATQVARRARILLFIFPPCPLFLSWPPRDGLSRVRLTQCPARPARGPRRREIRNRTQRS